MESSFSCLYVGAVRHRRFLPHNHEFTYRLYWLYLDLDELPSLFDRYWLWSARKFNFAWFKNSDHLRSLKDNKSLQGAPKEKLLDFLDRKGIHGIGRVRLLTNLRYFGFKMNPVSFYYCFDDENPSHLKTVVAEVSNTPWDEEHLYVVENVSHNGGLIAVDHLKKEFHVSPFMPMDMSYSMRYTKPGRKIGVRMTNFQKDEKAHDVVMVLKQRSMDSLNLALCLFQFPLVSLKIFGAIYWQALRLYLKATPFWTHPKKAGEEKLASAVKDTATN